MQFTTKKAREEWLRSEAAWYLITNTPPIRMSDLWLKDRHFIKIQRMYRRSHYDINRHRFVYDKEIILPDTGAQIFEVDKDNVIIEGQNIKSLVDIMIQEGL